MLIFDHNLNDSLYIQSCTFSGNLAVNGSAIYYDKVGSSFSPKNKYIFIDSCVFTQNSSFEPTGGNMLMFLGYFSQDENYVDYVHLNACQISNNICSNQKSLIEAVVKFNSTLTTSELKNNQAGQLISLVAEFETDTARVIDNQFSNNQTYGIVSIGGNSL
ncbi:MAG: hypothetical protein R2792_16175 [Saprospiraceae bacterium]